MPPTVPPTAPPTDAEPRVKPAPAARVVWPSRALAGLAGLAALGTLAWYFALSSGPTLVAAVFIGSFAVSGARAATAREPSVHAFWLAATAVDGLVASRAAASAIGYPLTAVGGLGAAGLAYWAATRPPRSARVAAARGAAAGLLPTALYWGAILGWWAP